MQKDKNLPALTGLRFFAAFSIVLHHCKGHLIDAETLGNVPFATAVGFFFVLSGFILAYNYPKFRTASDVKRFYLGRMLRIWPTHIFTFLLVCVVIFTDFASFLHSFPTAIANILLLQAWVPTAEYFFSLSAVSGS